MGSHALRDPASSHLCHRTAFLTLHTLQWEPLTFCLQMTLRWLSALSLALVWGYVVSSSSYYTTVAPPQDLHIADPGLLGSLDIEWKPPPNVQTFNECTVKYKFEYRNAGDREWMRWLSLTQLCDKIISLLSVIFTRKLKLRVGFDFSRTAEVKVQTLLEGRCTDDVEVQSDWIYAAFHVPLQGDLESEVQNFHCIYHDWEYLKCTWQPGLLAPRGVYYGLYYWYEGLDHARQCDDYIQDHGINIGCTLQNLSQAEYKDLSICVNGSAATTQLRPLYVTLRLHNLAKPLPPEQLVVSMSASEELHVNWSPPGGKTPPQCLEYEVQLAEDQGQTKDAWESVSTQMETALTISRANQSHISCVRVRGRTNILCADQGFWSEWTQECFSVFRNEDKQLFILIPVILSLSSSLIIFMLIGQCKKRSSAGKPWHSSMGC
ncbi:interleukin-13 receptor subunit alpha-2 isoform X3 [Cuculus canorus]|uniref:interleukin-13 receptor subunit alpha-2 isoform X3 n=1 Tax=Cuculus canorus TaxID=55661 RepID=UPI0023AA8E9E|nr:interleukin-13 receptor subunit alpha-2 isoform X3 [Cuculus canorus]